MYKESYIHTNEVAINLASRENTKVITKYGRIGIKNPASNEKNFANGNAAQIFLKKKINEKMNKGYIRIN